MAKIVITKATNAMRIVFNDEVQYGKARTTLKISHIVHVEERDDCVVLKEGDGDEFCFTWDQANENKDYGIVDSVNYDGIVTTDTKTKLFDELEKFVIT